MQLFECKTNIGNETKIYLVQADNFAQAEHAFNRFASSSLPGGYSLLAIVKSNTELAFAGYTNLNNIPASPRIGFAPDSNRPSNLPSQSNKVIIFD